MITNYVDNTLTTDMIKEYYDYYIKYMAPYINGIRQDLQTEFKGLDECIEMIEFMLTLPENTDWETNKDISDKITSLSLDGFNQLKETLLKGELYERVMLIEKIRNK